MISLSQMARLLEAVRPDARLILVGDPGQLTSIEAGVVLGDIVGPAATGLRMGAPRARPLRGARRGAPRLGAPGPAPAAALGLPRGRSRRHGRRRDRRARPRVPLRRGHRAAGRCGAQRRRRPRARRPERRSRPRSSGCRSISKAATAMRELGPVRQHTIATGRAVIEAARAGAAADALARAGASSGCCARTAADRSA